jgi:hypothetical protein
MRRLSLAVILILLTSTAIAKVEQTHKGVIALPKQEVGPAAPEFDALLQEVIDAVEKSGFKNVGVLPMFVISAIAADGKDVLLLVDPQTMQAIEVKDESANASTQR